MSFVASSVGSAASPAVVAVPSGVADNDVIVVLAIKDDTSPPTLPSGFTEVSGSPLTTTFDGMGLRVGVKLAASESGSYTFGTGTAIAAAIAFRDIVGGITNIQVSSYTDNAGQASPWTVPVPGITTPVASDLCYIASYDKNNNGTGASTAPSSFTLAQHIANGGYLNGQLSYRENVTAGATGTITGTGTQATLSAAVAGFLIALPLSAPTATPFRGINTGLIY